MYVHGGDDVDVGVVLHVHKLVPDFAMVVNRVYFQVSYDRGRSWSQPYKLPDLGMGLQLTSRTDYIVEDKENCLVFMSSKERMVQTEESLQDRAFCMRLRRPRK